MLSLFNSRTHNNQIACVRACLRACVRVWVCVRYNKNRKFHVKWLVYRCNLNKTTETNIRWRFSTLYTFCILLLLDMNSPFSAAFLTNE